MLYECSYSDKIWLTFKDHPSKPTDIILLKIEINQEGGSHNDISKQLYAKFAPFIGKNVSARPFKAHNDKGKAFIGVTLIGKFGNMSPHIDTTLECMKEEGQERQEGQQKQKQKHKIEFAPLRITLPK